MHIPKRFTGEKQVQTTAVLDVLLASEKNPSEHYSQAPIETRNSSYNEPVIWKNNLLGRVDETWLSICGRV